MSLIRLIDMRGGSEGTLKIIRKNKKQTTATSIDFLALQLLIVTHFVR